MRSAFTRCLDEAEERGYSHFNFQNEVWSWCVEAIDSWRRGEVFTSSCPRYSVVEPPRAVVSDPDHLSAGLDLSRSTEHSTPSTGWCENRLSR